MEDTTFADLQDVECPICHLDLEDAKILPCTHLACSKCLLSWLQKETGDCGCPLCRAPILSSNHPAQGNLATLVDALPTHLAVMALMKSRRVLSSSHVCAMCQNNVPATSFCTECEVKLCQACTAYHQRLPASKDHKVENLSMLTAKRLAEHYRLTCKTHPDMLAELFCPTHQQLICMLCMGTIHQTCTGKQAISDVAEDKREKLKQWARTLRKDESTLAAQIQKVKDKFKVAWKSMEDTYEDLQQCVEKQRRSAESQLRKQEDDVMASPQPVETSRAALASNASTVEQLASTAPQAALLGMLADMTSRLDQVQATSATAMARQLQWSEFSVCMQTLQQLKTKISSLGQITLSGNSASLKTKLDQAIPSKLATSSGANTSSPSQMRSQQASPVQSRTKPSGAELAKVLKVGDRVRSMYSGRTGTVTAIPSRIMAAQGRDPQGLIDVRGDDGKEDFYFMGACGLYHLQLP